jgi:iron-sulfur cluster repair protein YtfE (RIC family)
MAYISTPARVMEMEHDEAGEIMYQIRKLIGTYTPLADACPLLNLY